MKPNLPTAFFASSLFAITSMIQANVLVYEGFDYTENTRVQASNNLNGGTGWSNAWQEIEGNTNRYWGTAAGTLAYENTGNVGDLEISGGYIEVAGTQNDNRVIERSFTPTFNTTTNSDIWFSVLSAGPGGNGVDVNLFGGGSKQIGWQMDGTITLTNGLASGTDSSGKGMTVGSATLLVANIDLANSEIQYWLNPIVGSASPGSADYASNVLTLDSSVTSLDAIRLFANTQNSGKIDEIRFGETFADVTPVPEPSSLALLAGAMGMLIACRRLQSRR
ncbi:PEP-CTERM sorting domain-containing protein [Kiritimatiellaeota bacterium B1221]|nr:PEP-CTERM sorting domain-containing protein [Kiritimatiellaeota bacterium B1221]